jgi:hypothetical protein
LRCPRVIGSKEPVYTARRDMVFSSKDRMNAVDYSCYSSLENYRARLISH